MRIDTVCPTISQTYAGVRFAETPEQVVPLVIFTSGGRIIFNETPAARIENETMLNV